MKYTKGEIQEAKNVDMVDLLVRLGHRLKKHSSEYYLIEHDSLKVSHNKGWYWNSRGTGGNAIDFLMYYPDYQYDFMKAVELIRSIMFSATYEIQTKIEATECKPQPVPVSFQLPKRCKTNDNVRHYLINKRGLDEELIDACLSSRIIYESSRTHNAVFVGYDYSGNACSAFLRGTARKRFAADVEGSQKEYTFRIEWDPGGRFLHLFESPIDLLSYLTLAKIQNCSTKNNYLPLNGVSTRAVDTFLMERPSTDTIWVHLDNDGTGWAAARRIQTKYGKKYNVHVSPSWQKDFNDELLLIKEYSTDRKERSTLCTCDP